MYRLRLLVGLVVFGVGYAAWPHAESAPAPADLLKAVGQFTDEECAAVERGQGVARLLETGTREIAVVGAIRIAAPPEALITHFRDISRLKRSSLVLDASRFSPRPQPSDLTSLRIEEHNLDLRDCQPGDCPVRLSASDVRSEERRVGKECRSWCAPDDDKK